MSEKEQFEERLELEDHRRIDLFLATIVGIAVGLPIIGIQMKIKKATELE